MIVVVLVGAVQHRLACLGHEAAHYTLLNNRFWNEAVSDLFCIYPVFATTQAYRVHHIGHHLYPNDWERDPNLLNGGQTKHFDRFPMEKKDFVFLYFLRFFWPPYLLRHLWDIFYVNALGSGIAPVPVGHDDENPDKLKLSMRPATALGILYLTGLCASLFYGNSIGNPYLMLAPFVFLAVAILAVNLLPENAFFKTPVRAVYSARFGALSRIVFYTALFSTAGYMRAFTGINIGFYFLLFWVLPVFMTFPYFMLLREVYQHANADGGDLTNSRIFRNDWFTRWAIWTYGQDVHLVHHLYPNVPHYKLDELHDLLLRKSPDYASNVVEVHGTFRSRDDYPAIVDVMREMDPYGEIYESRNAPPTRSWHPKRKREGDSRRRAAAGTA